MEYMLSYTYSYEQINKLAIESGYNYTDFRTLVLKDVENITKYILASKEQEFRYVDTYFQSAVHMGFRLVLSERIITKYTVMYSLIPDYEHDVLAFIIQELRDMFCINRFRSSCNVVAAFNRQDIFVSDVNAMHERVSNLVTSKFGAILNRAKIECALSEFYKILEGAFNQTITTIEQFALECVSVMYTLSTPNNNTYKTLYFEPMISTSAEYMTVFRLFREFFISGNSALNILFI